MFFQWILKIPHADYMDCKVSIKILYLRKSCKYTIAEFQINKSDVIRTGIQLGVLS